MQFLRTLFWVVLAVIAVVFSFRNWTPVTVKLWGGLEADAKLPALLFAAFALGLIPAMVLHRATRWSMRRRLETCERALAASRPVEPEPVPTPVPVVADAPQATP